MSAASFFVAPLAGRVRARRRRRQALRGQHRPGSMRFNEEVQTLLEPEVPRPCPMSSPSMTTSPMRPSAALRSRMAYNHACIRGPANKPVDVRPPDQIGHIAAIDDHPTLLVELDGLLDQLRRLVGQVSAGPRRRASQVSTRYIAPGSRGGGSQSLGELPRRPRACRACRRVGLRRSWGVAPPRSRVGGGSEKPGRLKTRLRPAGRRPRTRRAASARREQRERSHASGSRPPHSRVFSTPRTSKAVQRRPSAAERCRARRRPAYDPVESSSARSSAQPRVRTLSPCT